MVDSVIARNDNLELHSIDDTDGYVIDTTMIGRAHV